MARQALLLVALRAEIPLNAARDDDDAAQARDLRTVALQGLSLPGAAGEAKLTVQVSGGHVDGKVPDDAPATAPAEPPSLSERERRSSASWSPAPRTLRSPASSISAKPPSRVTSPG